MCCAVFFFTRYRNNLFAFLPLHLIATYACYEELQLLLNSLFVLRIIFSQTRHYCSCCCCGCRNQFCNLCSLKIPRATHTKEVAIKVCCWKKVSFYANLMIFNCDSLKKLVGNSNKINWLTVLICAVLHFPVDLFWASSLFILILFKSFFIDEKL